MRKSCVLCAFKHLSAARVLYGEIQSGYNDDDHWSLCVGHLEQAESHCRESWTEVAEQIRNARKAWSEHDTPIDFLELIHLLRSAVESLPEAKDSAVPVPESASGAGPVGEMGVLGCPKQSG